jgi:hypothetical protein
MGGRGSERGCCLVFMISRPTRILTSRHISLPPRPQDAGPVLTHHAALRRSLARAHGALRRGDMCSVWSERMTWWRVTRNRPDEGGFGDEDRRTFHISQQPCHMMRCAWTKTRVVILTDRQLAGPPRKKKVRFGSFSDFSASVFGTFAMVCGMCVWCGLKRDVHWCA